MPKTTRADSSLPPAATPSPEKKKTDFTQKKKIPFETIKNWDKKDLSDRKLSRVQSLICFINRYFLKPLGILQGTFQSMLPDFNEMTEITETRMENFWNRFDDPSKAYLLLFRNPHGNAGDSQHSALVLGSTRDKGMESTSNYVSWSFRPEDMVVGGFLAKPNQNNFKMDFEGHGEPVVIELPGINVSAMQFKWNLIKARTRFYQLLGFNCSSVAARLLKAGVRSLGLVGEYQKGNPWGFWTPYDVSKVAEQIKEKLVGSEADHAENNLDN